jgi:hypothetical protein
MKGNPSTGNQALHLERLTFARGDTPLLEPDEITREACPYASGYDADTYQALLARGVPRLMCETFHMEYDSERGIILWADGDLYDTFAGPAMQKGDYWKIYLGRWISLDADDYDGSDFVEGLVEDALLFAIPPTKPSRLRWETVEESPGIWATRPIETWWRGQEDEDTDVEIIDSRQTGVQTDSEDSDYGMETDWWDSDTEKTDEYIMDPKRRLNGELTDI